MDTSHSFLDNADRDATGHGQCDPALMAYPEQLDCPWCGCGWQFTCLQCRRPFTFATGIEVDDPWDNFARYDLESAGVPDPPPYLARARAEAMEKLLTGVRVGQHYVYLDGAVILADAPGVHFTGWHSRHDLDFVPQVKALTDPSVVKDILANPDYWKSTAHGRGANTELVRWKRADLRPQWATVEDFADNPDIKVRELMEGFRSPDLRPPVRVLPDGTVVSDYRRVLAARLLGWKDLNVRVVHKLTDQGEDPAG
jgi:hypothetical protein